MQSSKNWKEGKGLIVMMDALGMRNENLDKSREHMEKIQAFKSKDERYREKFESIVYKSPSLKYVLGDTFVFVYPMKDEEEYCTKTLTEAAQKISHIFHSALYTGIWMRGAAAFGEYLIDNDERTILGPGISDAASEYETADWSGIVLTEKTGTFYNPSAGERHRFIQYDVPISKKSQKNGIGATKKLWALDWCRHLPKMDENRFLATQNDHIPELGRNYLTGRFPEPKDIPQAVYQKYINSLLFYDFCMKDWNPSFI